jgi:hypothetical protein
MMVYLASPYTHSDPWVREERYKQNLAALVHLLLDGKTVFSPIVHSHHADRMMAHLKDHDFWMKQSINMLVRCDSLTVLMLDGWQRSKGVEEEIRMAQRLGFPIDHLEWPQ